MGGQVNYKYNFLLMLLPLVWIWGLYRIKKLRLGALIQLAMIGGFIALSQFTDHEMFLLGISFLSIPLWWVLNKKWTEEYNSKIAFK